MKSSSGASGESKSEVSQLEGRIQGRLAEVRTSLKSVYTAASNSSRSATGPNDAILQLYFKLKSDTRAILTYYRDAAARMPDRPAISMANNTISVVPKDSKNTNVVATAPVTADAALLQFEQAFELRDESGLPLDQQKNRNETFLLRRIAEMTTTKDAALYRLINASLEQLGIGEIVSEKHLPPNLDTCSRELPMLFHFVKTFKTLGKKAQLSSLVDSQKENAREIQQLRIQVEQLQVDVSARLAEIFDLRGRLDAAALSSERQNLIVRQQDDIADLNKTIEEMKREHARLYEDYRREVQEKAFAKDQIAVMQTKLDNAKITHERDVQRLQPILEDHLKQGQSDAMLMQTLRNDTALQAARLARAEMRMQEAEAQTGGLKAQIKALEHQLQQSDKNIKALEQEGARQGRLKAVLTAAKVRYHNLALEREKDAAAADEQSKEMHAHCVAYAAAVSNLQAYVRELEDALTRSEEEAGELKETMRLNNVDLKGFDLQTALLREEAERATRMSSGSAQSMQDLDDTRTELAETRAELERRSKQLQTAMQRIYELQGQLMDAQGIYGDAKSSND